MKADYQRAESLFQRRAGRQQDYEVKKFTYDAQVAAVQQSEARLVQAQAQREQTAAQLTATQRRIAVARASLTRINDILHKYDSFAPLDAWWTNLPVRAGETVVPGLQNQTGTLIMTIADMSLITAEVKVDETDIVNVKVGQTPKSPSTPFPTRLSRGT